VRPDAARSLPLTDELSVVFARMSGLLLSRETTESLLPLTTSLASEVIAGAAAAGVTLTGPRGERVTEAATDPRVERADSLQYELDEGPCLTAWKTRSVVRVDDLTTEARWPRWAGVAAQSGWRAALSAPLVAGDACLGAMKVYADQAGVYDARSERLLTLFAAQVAVMVSNMQTYEASRRSSELLKTALRDRDLVSQAKGVIIGARGVNEDAAFALLVSTGRRLNRSVRDIARDIVDSAPKRRR